MAVAIRLKRFGTKSKPYFRVVAVDSHKKRDGKVLEYMGTYCPMKKGENFSVLIDKIEAWVKKGAVLSETVASFYRKSKNKAGV